MTITKNTIIAEILNNDPTQGCVPSQRAAAIWSSTSYLPNWP